MTEFIDCYEVLQVHPRAEPEVIEKAYKALMLKYHPDQGGDTERAKRINLAYEVLRDPSRRADYNLDWAVQQRGMGVPTSGPVREGHLESTGRVPSITKADVDSFAAQIEELLDVAELDSLEFECLNFFVKTAARPRYQAAVDERRRVLLDRLSGLLRLAQAAVGPLAESHLIDSLDGLFDLLQTKAWEGSEIVDSASIKNLRLEHLKGCPKCRGRAKHGICAFCTC